MILEFLLEKKHSDEEMLERHGHFFKESDFSIRVRENADGYIMDENNMKRLLFRFRKNVIPEDLCQLGISCFEKPSRKKTYSRGASAGILDVNRLPPNVTVIPTEKFRGKMIYKDIPLNYQIGNMANSNIVGYYEDFKNEKSDIKCRMTKFTREHPEVWKNSLPLIKYIDDCFKKEVPERWKNQYEQAMLTDFSISETSFSTITLNNNFQTALHKDKGDYSMGFGNLVVFRRGAYVGGYLGIPQYDVLIEIDHGDHLLFDVHQWHCNTPIHISENDTTSMRLSLVLYLREKIVRKCKRIIPRKDTYVPFYKRMYLDIERDILKQSYLKSRIICASFDGLFCPSTKYKNILLHLIEKYNIPESVFKYVKKTPKQNDIKTLNADYSMKETFHYANIYHIKVSMVILISDVSGDKALLMIECQL